MSRLTPEMVLPIPGNLPDLGRRLQRVCGYSLQEIALRAAFTTGSRQENPKPGGAGSRIASTTVGIVPIRWGEGIIEGFNDACREIALHLGFRAFVTAGADLSGFAEAVELGAEIVLVSDDDVFLACNVKRGLVVRNRVATACGFVTLFDKMIGGAGGKKVLVIGLGPVGAKASELLLQSGAIVTVYDIDKEKEAGFLECAGRAKAAGKGRLQTAKKLNTALRRNEFIFNAAPADDLISEHDVSDRTYVCSPALPHGLTPEAARFLGDRFYHDKLELGVAVMLVQCTFL